MEIVFLCLKKLDLDLELWESDSWYESQMIVGDNYSPLTQATQDLGLYYQDEVWNCYDVLDRLLKSKCASLYQSDGTWHITQDNWVYQEEEDPAPPVYPPVSFGVVRVGYGDQKGKVNIIDLTGGDPLQGQFMVSVNGGTYIAVGSLPVSPTGGRTLSNLAYGNNTISIKRENGTEVVSSEVFFGISFSLLNQYYGQLGNNVVVGNMFGGESDDGYEFSDNGISWTAYNDLNILTGGKGYRGLSSREGYIYMRWRNAPETESSLKYFIDMGFTARKSYVGLLPAITVSDIGGIAPLSDVRFKIDNGGWISIGDTLEDLRPVEGSPGSYYKVIGTVGKTVQMRYLTDNSYIVTRNV